MPFDQPTRNRLARFVSDARVLLTEEFTRQLQQEYGLDPARGEVTDLARLSHLDDARRATAMLLRETLDYYLASQPKPDAKIRREALHRIVREQAFTILNRLCALRMAESRGLLIESVGQGYRSKGFQLYNRLAGTALGETGDAYRAYLYSLFDELALELPALFDRYAPEGRLFPREAALLEVLTLINAPDIAPQWAEDETIGWIYQYFNSVEERRQMRAESAAPRNSRELAVRNQFFTPRYVVEFLTDNTLGRIWYEMTAGSTQLAETCRYLVRRPLEIFLPETGFEGHRWDLKAHDLIFDEGWRQLPENPDWRTIQQVALAIDGYDMEEQVRVRLPGFTSVGDLANERAREYHQTGIWRGNSLELWLCLFFEQRRHAHFGDAPEGKGLAGLLALYGAWRSVLAQEAAETDQAALLKQPVYIRPRPLKDPRDIRMLDPACGSMHFGLYAFDLYERIYAEAWDMQASGQWPVANDQSDHRPLLTAYSSKEAFLADVPRLIIEHNIHGIDIDPRAVQIAGLSLWLRAQRSWQAQGIKSQDRPQIRRSNIVCAEPMPGDRALLEEFLKTLREERLEGLIRRVLRVPANQRVRATPAMADALCDLVRTVWKEMELAGEAGSLLKIEEALADAVARGKAEWHEKMPLFRVVNFGLSGPVQVGPKVSFTRTVPDEEGVNFWDRAETLVLTALQDYAERTENGGSYQRWMFAGDAARGFAFIDLCRKRCDVVLMNPPFGELVESTSARIESSYRSVTGNILCAFIESFAGRRTIDGFMGCVVDRTVLIKNSYETFRSEQLVLDGALASVIELGWNVLDANVEVAAVTIGRRRTDEHGEVFGANVTLQQEKDVALLQRCVAPVFARHIVFERMPFMAINFETPPFFLSCLRNMSSFSDEYGAFYNGHTIKSDVFKRLAWEVPLMSRERIWQRMWNGSDYSPFYVPMQEVVLVERYAGGLVNHESTVYRSPDKHMLPGLCYGKRGDYLDVQILPRDCVLTNEGFGGPFAESSATWSALGLLNSRVAQYMLNLYCGQHKGVGYVGQLPVPSSERLRLVGVDKAAAELYVMVRAANRILDTDPSFVSPFVGLAQGCSSLCGIAERYVIAQEAYAQACLALDQTLVGVYGVSDEELKVVYRDTASRPTAPLVLDFPVKDVAQAGRRIAALVVSYLIGCIYGRWDIRFATGQLPAPELAPPFSPLPVCPPGMLQTGNPEQFSFLDSAQTDPLQIAWEGIIPSDHEHPRDLERRVRKALVHIWHDSADAVEHEACQLLDTNALRDYLAYPDRFFADHLQSHSKSRRQAPIYWPLSTPSGSYTLWLYYHRLTDQTLYTCVNDFVDPKLAAVGSQLAVLRRKSGRSREEERELEQLTDLETELKDFRAELLRIAAFWKPNLNDGVQITAAPLWRLFQHRPWQKTLKETWEKLEAGDYDWAHLAMSIWPARLVPKCVTDRSLAIAHDVEDLFWVEDGGRWRNLGTPDEELAEQVRRQQQPGRDPLRSGLAALTLAEGRGLRCDQVYEALAVGRWDDLTPALLLWPERVAAKCWDDPLLALTLGVQLPARPTKAGRSRFVKEQVDAGCPDLVAGVEEALRDRPDRFATFWAELARGDHDGLSLALALWPQRVVEKCARDVELAERHGVRRYLWVRGDGGVWRRRMVKEREITDEIRRRTP